MRYSNPSERYTCGLSPNGMYLTGSKKSVRFEGSARKLQFCSAGNGFNGGRAGSGAGPGGWGSGVCALAGNTERARRMAINTSHQRFALLWETPTNRPYEGCKFRVFIPRNIGLRRNLLAPAVHGRPQSEHRLTDASNEISIRPSRSSHFLTSTVRSPRLISGSSSKTWPPLRSCCRQDRQAVPDEGALLNKRAGRPKAPLRYQSVHVCEMVRQLTKGSIALAGAATRTKMDPLFLMS